MTTTAQRFGAIMQAYNDAMPTMADIENALAEYAATPEVRAEAILWSMLAASIPDRPKHNALQRAWQWLTTGI